MVANDKLPLDVTLELGGPRPLSAAILYGSLADNDKCTPLEYEVLVRAKGAWKKVDSVKVRADARTLAFGNFRRLTWYDNPWIFVHRFAPVEADAIRFHFTRTTTDVRLCGSGRLCANSHTLAHRVNRALSQERQPSPSNDALNPSPACALPLLPSVGDVRSRAFSVLGTWFALHEEDKKRNALPPPSRRGASCVRQTNLSRP